MEKSKKIYILIFWFGLISLLVILPLSILLECKLLEIAFLCIYGVSGLFIYFIGINNLKETKKESILQKEQIKKLYEMTITDSLTGIYNRSFIFDKLSEVSRNLSNRDIPVSIIIFDVDLFKEINDEYGHLAGDEALRNIAKVVESNIRSSDIVGRYGGEEFLIISPNTNIKEAEHLAENIRKKVEESTKGKITISLGLTEIISVSDVDSAIKRADDAMYLAKDKGRNKVMVG